ncbi:MAG: macro domain-containing protein [Clostridia bacterium]|nr:macro domain-containing protein [Clostridia bacterium]
MPLQFIREHVTRFPADVIVNPANRNLRPGEGLSRAVFEAAGPRMRAACEAIGGCEPGGAVLTPGFGLPAKWVVHAVGPLWLGGFHGEEKQLDACYRRSLALAAEKGAASIALPLISAGTYGYPKDKAFRVALQAVAAFLETRETAVYLSVYDPKAARPDPADCAALLAAVSARGRGLLDAPEETPLEDELPSLDDMSFPAPEEEEAPGPEPSGGFMARALEIMGEKGLDEGALCYRANMSRRRFLALRGAPGGPDRREALALCVGLGLPLDEARALLARAGHVLSGRDRADVIAAWSLARGGGVFRLNAALYAFGEETLCFL